jgi:hypothetical protein
LILGLYIIYFLINFHNIYNTKQNLSILIKTANGQVNKVNYFNILWSIFYFFIILVINMQIKDGILLLKSYLWNQIRNILKHQNSVEKDGLIMLIQQKLKVIGK